MPELAYLVVMKFVWSCNFRRGCMELSKKRLETTRRWKLNVKPRIH
jgi:hypothetical protein